MLAGHYTHEMGKDLCGSALHSHAVHMDPVHR